MEGPLTAAEVRGWRSHFPILERCTYLINNSLGAMPREVEDELSRYSTSWSQRGVLAWHEGWWEMAVSTGNLLAPILGVGLDQVSMHPNVSLATALFLSCFDFPGHRNRLLLTELEFPTLIYVADRQRRRGAELVMVAPPEGGSDPSSTLLAAIDERTRVVVVSQALFRTGTLVDAPAIARRCRDTGAVLLLDVYQSAGALPLALQEWGVHAAVGGTLKWLCGGPGVAFLWVDPNLASQLEPAVTGWQADAAPFAFRAGSIQLAEGPWRFLTGTPNIPGLHACRPGCRIIDAVGVDRIRRRSLELTARILERAEAVGLEVWTPREPKRRGGTVSVWHPEAERLCDGLISRRVLCDYRPEAGIRLSPHFYNTPEECDHAIDQLAELAAQT